MAAQTKLEKKTMEEKISKVRQVVQNVRTNDIVLALHNFELNVEKTIQAFVERGSEGALGGWELNGGSGAKKRQQKKSVNKQSISNASARSYNVVMRSQTNSVMASPPLPLENDGHSNGYASIKANGNDAKSIIPSSTVDFSPKNTIGDGVPSDHLERNSTMNGSQNSNLVDAVDFDKLDQTTKFNVLQSHIMLLNRYAEENDQFERDFEDHFSASELKLTQCFNEIRRALDEREHNLRTELVVYRQKAHETLFQRRHELKKLKSCSNSLRTADEEGKWIFALRAYHMANSSEQQIAQLTRLSYNHSKLIEMISRLGDGSVVSVQQPQSSDAHSSMNIPATQQEEQNVTHSVSHSSLVSSIGEDSGFGQISPTIHEKSTAHMSGANCVMASDALSADQLAEIQQRIEETLRAQGIDPSMLSDLKSISTVVPRSRRLQPSGKSGNNDASGSQQYRDNRLHKSGKGGGGINRNQQQQVKLSILEKN